MKNDHLPRQARDKHRCQTEQNMTAVVLLCRSGGASLDGKKRISVAPFYAKNASFYQDRLGTNTGKTQKEMRFLTGTRGMGRP
jgi:hypothetical protein